MSKTKKEIKKQLDEQTKENLKLKIVNAQNQLQQLQQNYQELQKQIQENKQQLKEDYPNYHDKLFQNQQNQQEQDNKDK